MVTLVHFHLINPIMVGKKKTNDVQFYTEARTRSPSARRPGAACCKHALLLHSASLCKH